MNKVLIFGATGMIGGEVMQLCLEDDSIDEVISISRRTSGLKSNKLKEIIREKFSPIR